MNAFELEQALVKAVGDTKEDAYEEWWSEYTGLNGFYHLLAGEDNYTTNKVNAKKVSDGVVEVKGLGIFRRVETLIENFDTYEPTWDNVLIFEHDGKTYRVEGHLDSHNGGVWNGRLEEVKPVEKTVTVWEKA